MKMLTFLSRCAKVTIKISELDLSAFRFMAAIEVITSQEREVTIKKVTGETTTVLVRVWNETVSNLTLMALGSSAPGTYGHESNKHVTKRTFNLAKIYEIYFLF